MTLALSPTHHISEELEKASSLLSTASDLMTHGRLVNITSLERMVSSICNAVEHTGYQHCRPLRPLIQDLFERINAFGIDMTTHYGFLSSLDETGDNT